MRLTDIAVRNLQPPESGQITYTDDVVTGFGVRVSQGGAKAFTLVFGRDRRRITIGKVGTVSLADARQEARRVLAEHTLGKTRPKIVRWDEAVRQFILACEEKNKPRTVSGYKRLLERHFLFKQKPLPEISYEDIDRKLTRIKMPAEKNHALVAVKIFLRWCQKPPRRYIQTNPCEGLTPVKRKSRKRVLSDQELAAVLTVALEGKDFYSQIVALLILTFKRRGEIAQLRWPWINTTERTITLPDDVTKNKEEQVFVYGPMAAKIIDRLPRLNSTDYLFPGGRCHVRGKPTTCFNSWAKSKPAFDKRLIDAGFSVAHWTLHDLRRNATKLAPMKVAPHVVDMILGHKLGTTSTGAGGIVSAVAEIYNPHLYVPEMQESVARWEGRLSELMLELGSKTQIMPEMRKARLSE